MWYLIGIGIYFLISMILWGDRTDNFVLSLVISLILAALWPISFICEVIYAIFKAVTE